MSDEKVYWSVVFEAHDGKFYYALLDDHEKVARYVQVNALDAAWIRIAAMDGVGLADLVQSSVFGD